MKNGSCPNCLTSQALADREKGKLDVSDIDLAYAVSSPFGAGIDTTAGTLSVFLCECLSYDTGFVCAEADLVDD
jgi:hypothetical protein